MGVVSIVHVVPGAVVPALEPFLEELYGTCQHTAAAKGWVGAAVEASLIWALPSMIYTRNHQEYTFHLSHISLWASQIPRSVARAKKPWLLPSKLLAWQRLDSSGCAVAQGGTCSNFNPPIWSNLQCWFLGQSFFLQFLWEYCCVLGNLGPICLLEWFSIRHRRHRKWCRVNFNILAIEVR